MTHLSLLMDSASVRSPGGERLQEELAAAVDRTMPDDAEALVVRRPDQEALQGFQRVRVEVSASPVSSSTEKWRWYRRGLPRHARDAGASAVFAANGIFSERLREHCGVVATTNNMLLFSPDQLRDYPLWSTARARFRLLRELTERGLKNADRIVLHSHHALELLQQFVPRISEKTSVVHTGVPSDTRLNGGTPGDPPNEGRPYFLYFSALRRFKNHLALIEGYRRLLQRVDDLPDLILAGVCKDPEYLRAIEAAIEGATAGDRIRYAGALPRETIPAWLHHATVNVFPSLCETSSVIQAEILGVHGVMATSDVAPMPETAGDAAELFDPHDPDDIARALERLWRSPERRDELRRLARRRADELSWDRCGETIWSAAREAAEQFQQRSR